MSALPFVGAAALAGCGTAMATDSVSEQATPSAPIAQVAAPAPTARIPVRAPSAATREADRLVALAGRQFLREARGPVARGDLRLIAGDPGLRSALRSGSDATLRMYVHARFTNVWYHRHVSRLQILRGSRVIVDEGVPFVVDGPHSVLRAGSGRAPVTVRISIQDEVGFVRLLHRHHPVDVVVRGPGAGHVRTSLAAALHAGLPDRGMTTIAGHRYVVRSLSHTALGGEPVKIWLLVQG